MLEEKKVSGSEWSKPLRRWEWIAVKFTVNWNKESGQLSSLLLICVYVLVHIQGFILP